MSEHRPITGDNLAPPAGPYVPGMGFERLVFVSGQGPRDPATKELVGPGVAAQTEQVLKNLDAILTASGSSMQHVLRCGVFLVDMADFPEMNAVYERMFAGHKPARTTVQVAALPAKGMRVEIDAIAYVPRDRAI
ncbi:MAG: Rid family detoxifying hydrolase [Proteobacteria bacterium]|nr:Rid family detoxifying hydrolase [Pseudomonadota bacterium]